MKRSILFRLGAISAGVAVIAGAFGAHGASGKAVDWLHTGASYQLVHAVAVFGLAHWPQFTRQAWALLGGSALFAFTLYLMALGMPLWLGAITPIGGALMIIGWFWIGLARFSIEKTDDV